MTTFSPPGPMVPEAKTLFPKDLARMMAAGHPHCYVATASVGYPIDLMNKVRKGLNLKGASFLMIYTPCQKGFVYETPRSIDLGRLVVECGLYPIWEWNNEKREYDYSFRPQSMRPVSEYLKLQGRFGHLHAEHIATLQRFANQQWRMMGVGAAGSADPRDGSEGAHRHGVSGGGRGGRAHGVTVMSDSSDSGRATGRKATSSPRARSAARRATCGRRRSTTGSTPFCACTPATRS